MEIQTQATRAVHSRLSAFRFVENDRICFCEDDSGRCH